MTKNVQGGKLGTEVTTRDGVHVTYFVPDETAVGAMPHGEGKNSVSEERAQGEDGDSQISKALCGRTNSFRYFSWFTESTLANTSDPKCFEKDLPLVFSAFHVADVPWSNVGLIPWQARKSELHLRKHVHSNKKRKKSKRSRENTTS